MEVKAGPYTFHRKNRSEVLLETDQEYPFVSSTKRHVSMTLLM